MNSTFFNGDMNEVSAIINRTIVMRLHERELMHHLDDVCSLKRDRKECCLVDIVITVVWILYLTKELHPSDRRLCFVRIENGKERDR